MLACSVLEECSPLGVRGDLSVFPGGVATVVGVIGVPLLTTVVGVVAVLLPPTVVNVNITGLSVLDCIVHIQACMARQALPL